MADLATLVDTVRRDGFVVVRDFFPPELVARAHAELESWYARDLEDRKAKDITEPVHQGPAGKTVLTRPSHLLIDAYGRSAAFDAMFEKILTDPLSRGLLDRVAGRRFKMRGYNVRRMTGAYDPPPAHEWHRDSPGEFCVGIFLTDVEPEEHGATALVPGSHRFPYDPRWNALFSEPYRGLKVFLRKNRYNRRLAQTALHGATGAYGRRGDFYLFLNDVWHGRQPNLHGRETMVALLGAFPTEFPYPDRVPMPPPDVVGALPGAIREVVRQDQPANETRDTFIHEMLDTRPQARFRDPFYMARLERKVADAVSYPYVTYARTYTFVSTRLAFFRHYLKLNVYLPARSGVRRVYRRMRGRQDPPPAGVQSKG
jgi:putative 2OG-Fe(II) oxygenase